MLGTCYKTTLSNTVIVFGQKRKKALQQAFPSLVFQESKSALPDTKYCYVVVSPKTHAVCRLLKDAKTVAKELVSPAIYRCQCGRAMEFLQYTCTHSSISTEVMAQYQVTLCQNTPAGKCKSPAPKISLQQVTEDEKATEEENLCDFDMFAKVCERATLSLNQDNTASAAQTPVPAPPSGLQSPAKACTAYSDGSYGDGKMGVGYELHGEDGREVAWAYIVQKKGSSMEAEFLAAKAALERAVVEGYTKVTLVYDAEAVRHHANFPPDAKSSATCKEYYQAVQNIKHYIDIEFVWVKNHPGRAIHRRVDKIIHHTQVDLLRLDS
jgi:ribonuclease HI